MEPVRRALWFIESHYAESISLADIADASGISRFHLSRSFAHVTGTSIARYLRQRRLTEAARELARGESDVLTIALSVGYGSHAAFTRAFRAQFSVTPESVRAQRSVDPLTLTEPYEMPDDTAPALPEPRIHEAGPLYLAGLREYRSFDDLSAIPGQWQRFAPHLAMQGRVDGSSYGACFESPDDEGGFEYLVAVALQSLDLLPEGLSGASLAPRRYAVFEHADHVSTIGATCAAIAGDWQPKNAERMAQGSLTMLEHYGPEFDPITGRGGIEIWMPLSD